jgi:hypothetical protein
VPAASPNFKNDSNEVYIEAADGERFLVMVELLKDFDAKGGTHLSIEYEVDESGGINGYPSLSALKEKTHGDPQLKGRDWCEETTRKIGGDWIDCGFTFSSLKAGTNHYLCHYLPALADSNQMKNST